MNETHLYDFDTRLDQAIDALNREVSPSPHERGDHEMLSLVDTARLMKSLRDPAEPGSGFESQAVDRLVRELAPLQPSQTSNDGTLPTSTTTTPSADEPVSDRSHPSRIRRWMREVPELAAILLLFALVLGGVAIYQSMRSENDETATGGTQLSGDFDVYVTAGQGAGPRSLIPIDKETLLDRENMPEGELPSSYSLARDGSTLVRIEYAREIGPGDEPLAADEVTIVVQDGFGGAERLRFHPEEHVGWPILSNDGSRLAVQSALKPDSSQPPRWHIYNTLNGDLVGTIERDSRIGRDTLFFNADATKLIRAWVSPASVTDTPEPLRMMAYDIATGDEIDRVELTDIPAGAWNLDPDAGTPMTNLLIPAVAISPDGRQIAVAHADTQTVTLLDAETLTVQDTIHIAADDAGPRPWFESAPGSTAVQTRDDAVTFAVFSPDGRQLYLHATSNAVGERNRPEFGLTLVDLDQRSVLARAYEGEQIDRVIPAPDGQSIYVTTFIQSDEMPQRVQRLDAVTLDVLAERRFEDFNQIVIDPVGRDPAEDAADDVVPTPAATAENTPITASEPASTQTPAVTPIEDGIASILERFEEMQGNVDFELAIPVQLDGFELQENGLTISGPPTAPAVNATFIDNSSSPPRMIGFAQRPGGFGDDPPRDDQEAVPITIQGVETTLYREPREGELPILRVRWEVNGVHYDIGATNIEEETLLEIVNSIALLSEIEFTSESAAPTPVPIPQNQAPMALASVEWPTDRDGIEALAAAMPEELNGLERRLLGIAVETDRISVSYGPLDEFDHPGLTIIDLTSGSFFPPDWTATDLIAYQISSDDAIDVGQDSGVVWATENVTVQGVPTLAIRWAPAESTWIFSISAGDENSLELLVAAAITAAGSE